VNTFTSPYSRDGIEEGSLFFKSKKGLNFFVDVNGSVMGLVRSGSPLPLSTSLYRRRTSRAEAGATHNLYIKKRSLDQFHFFSFISLGPREPPQPLIYPTGVRRL